MSPEPFHVYLDNIFGAPSIAKAAMFSLLDDRRGSTSRDADYLRNLGIRIGESAISETAKYGIAALLHQDPSFTACDCHGLAGRVRHAVIGPFTARNRERRSVFSVVNVAGVAAVQLVSGARDARGRGGMGHAAIGVAGMVVVDLIREFVPRRHM